MVCAFISYSHQDRAYGAQAKGVLAEVGIEAFLAHDDLEVSEEWRERILIELRRCDLFVALLSANFLSSKWAPQEAGFIVSRPEVVIAPLSIDGTTPFGFLSHLQAGRITKDGITRELLVAPLARRSLGRFYPVSLKSPARLEAFALPRQGYGPSCRSFQSSRGTKPRLWPKHPSIMARSGLGGCAAPSTFPS